MGSRFYAAEEALAPEAAKARIVAGSGDDTLRTRVFDIVRGRDWPPQYTGRALKNRFSQTWHGSEAALAAGAASENPRYAAAAGDVDIAVMFTGEGIDLIHAVEPAGEILERVIAEAEAALARRFG